jgi:hypothetical protein
VATILVFFSYGIPKNKFEKKVYHLLSDANTTGNKSNPDVTISILAKRYRDVLKAAKVDLNEKPFATQLMVIRTKTCVALMRKYVKTGKIERFCDVSLTVINQKK